MPPIPQTPRTDGSTTFSPDTFFTAWKDGTLTPPYDKDFRKFILRAFGLPLREEEYVYTASAEVSLLQVQTYLEFGAQGGLLAWYRDSNGEVRDSPPAADIAAYTDIFRPTTSTHKALTALASNAKKDTLRAEIAQYLLANYHPPAAATKLVVPKSKTHVNPAFDLWAWTVQSLLWAGPEPLTANVKISHAILPVLYHHFGCVCPSYESLYLIQLLARGRRMVDMGSGNGYWTYMLRQLPPLSGGKKGKTLEVVSVDSGISEWRTIWVEGTIQADGEDWLKRNDGAREDVLLLVYPSVGNDFTSKMIKAYNGTTIISAGSQNASGFTAFAKETIADWMARELPEWERVLQIPLPSFAGKDEALFVFEKGGDSGKAAV